MLIGHQWGPLAVSQQIFISSVTKMCLWNTHFKVQPHLSGGNELNSLFSMCVIEFSAWKTRYEFFQITLYFSGFSRNSITLLIYFNLYCSFGWFGKCEPLHLRNLSVFEIIYFQPFSDHIWPFMLPKRLARDHCRVSYMPGALWIKMTLSKSYLQLSLFVYIYKHNNKQTKNKLT